MSSTLMSVVACKSVSRYHAWSNSDQPPAITRPLYAKPCSDDDDRRRVDHERSRSQKAHAGLRLAPDAKDPTRILVITPYYEVRVAEPC